MELLTEKMKQFDRAQLRAAVFDLDGTLLDTVRDLGTAANVTLAHFGFPQHPLEAYQGFIGNGLLMLYRRAAPAGTDEATVEALRDYGRDYYREHCTGLTQVYDGVPELLHGLAELLGLGEDATEEQVMEALKACLAENRSLKEAEKQPPENVVPPGLIDRGVSAAAEL